MSGQRDVFTVCGNSYRYVAWGMLRLNSWGDAPGWSNIAPLALYEEPCPVAEMILQFAGIVIGK